MSSPDSKTGSQVSQVPLIANHVARRCTMKSACLTVDQPNTNHVIFDSSVFWSLLPCPHADKTLCCSVDRATAPLVPPVFLVICGQQLQPSASSASCCEHSARSFLYSVCPCSAHSSTLACSPAAEASSKSRQLWQTEVQELAAARHQQSRSSTL